MQLKTCRYVDQVATWPRTGRHILAQFDDESVVVYQAFRPAIGRFAAEHDYFGGEFKLTRMSWIKTNFLWMMYRSGWGRKAGQEVLLAIWLKRGAFDVILSRAVPATNPKQKRPPAMTRAPNYHAVKRPHVRLQWDPDHDPHGINCRRRAIQLGLRGKCLEKYATDWILEIQDISAFVREQRTRLDAGQVDALETPTEVVYPVEDPQLRAQLELD